MLDAAHLQSTALDVQTLSFVAASIAALLGLFLSFAWMQHRETCALAWWGSAYLTMAAAIALWSAPSPYVAPPLDVPAALLFVACGMIWNGVRQFLGRRQLWRAVLSGAAFWLVLRWLLPDVPMAEAALATAIVAAYTIVIGIELLRERRRSQYSRVAAITVTSLHAAIIFLPTILLFFLPQGIAQDWLSLFVMGVIIYAVAIAFGMLLIVKDHHVQIYRKAATIDNLTGLLNRGAFLPHAVALCAKQAKKRRPVTVMMFDLDHFKSINDRFGHATGDHVLRLFAQVAEKSMRATDIVGRYGGEEFVAIVPEPLAGAIVVSERLRVAFEALGVKVDANLIGATVSIGVATSADASAGFETLMARADAALYAAKHGGRNRVSVAEDVVADGPARPDRPHPVAKPGPLPAGTSTAQRVLRVAAAR